MCIFFFIPELFRLHAAAAAFSHVRYNDGDNIPAAQLHRRSLL